MPQSAQAVQEQPAQSPLGDVFQAPKIIGAMMEQAMCFWVPGYVLGVMFVNGGRQHKRDEEHKGF